MLHQSGSVISTTNFREDLYSSTTPSARDRCWISFTPMWCCAMVALPPPGTQPSPAWPCLRPPALPATCVCCLCLMLRACWLFTGCLLLLACCCCCFAVYICIMLALQSREPLF
ncbi:unnamed protein product [Triticum turgidum subsp. durum]|uniref:Uncharacterized protein n=1 Tax=Triticum turgidum subsp. durum TaxID=4567 RepID=A0A9R1R2N7_TRITD|nr:unnamed protein product [Triticum turgidum subsp. durum]